MFYKLLSSLLILLCAASIRAQIKTSPDITAGDVAERISILASDSLEGRRTGQSGAEKAANYIASEFKRIKLQTLGANGYLQPYTFSEHALDTSVHALTHGVNVVGYIRGSDPKLADQTVIIGAHYDHLGYGGTFALDTVHAIHYGADDNASGTTGVLEIAENLANQNVKPKRSIVFITFSGEEEGLFGSGYFTDHPLVKLGDVQAMLNMDMIGRMQPDSTLIVEGLGSSPVFRELIDSLNHPREFHLKYFQTGTGPSDHAKFYAKDVPVLFFFTGFHEDYHRATDTKEKINNAGEANIAKYVESIALALANRDDKIPFTRSSGDTERKAASFGVYVGGVPDYGYEGDGLRISEIREHSPAEIAGLQKGDIIVQFDDMKIKNIYDYTNGLAKHHPGDLVQYKVIRGNKTITIPVVLGHRTTEH